MLTSQKYLDLHDDAMRRFDIIQSMQRDERAQCKEDRRFASIAGAQWEDALKEQFANRVRLEMNKVHLAIVRIINEYRNNRISVSFVPKDGTSDKLSDTCAGLYRADEQDSNAEEAYDNAFEEGASGGIGAWRLRTCYEDEYDDENEKQRIKIEPIFDADSTVFFDIDAKRQDKADSKRCYVLTPMSRDAYKEEYGDDPTTWPKNDLYSNFDWVADDTVYLAEYYKIDEKSTKIYYYEGINGDERKVKQSEIDEDEELLNTLDATGFKLTRTRNIKSRIVRKYLLSGGGVLEDMGVIAGQHIPIVPFYGKRWFIDNIERCMGHVRMAKDPQRLHNMQVSKLAEFAAFSSAEKPILTPEQILGHQQMWADDAVVNYPYRLVNAINDVNGNSIMIGPQSYTKPTSIPPAMAAILQVTEKDLQDILGTPQAGDQMQPNLSGVAVEMIQNRLDMQTYIYLSNFKKSMRRSGEIWLSMAREIMVESGRKMKVIDGQDEAGSVVLRQPVMGDSGAVENENDIIKADYQVTIDVGPASISRRNSTVRVLRDLLSVTQDPETMQVLSSMIMLNIEGEGISDVRDYYRKKLLRMGVLTPTKEESQELKAEAANQQPDPNAVYLEAAAKESEAKAIKANADTALTIAKTEQTRADTANIIAGTSIEAQQHMVSLANELETTATAQPNNASSQGASNAK